MLGDTLKNSLAPGGPELTSVQSITIELRTILDPAATNVEALFEAIP
jgi:hypothetical protein